MVDARDARIKRLLMRSMRRGIKEMDLILGAYSRERLATLSEDELTVYEALLDENDHDIYGWITGQMTAPAPFRDLIGIVSDHARAGLAR